MHDTACYAIKRSRQVDVIKSAFEKFLASDDYAMYNAIVKGHDMWVAIYVNGCVDIDHSNPLPKIGFTLDRGFAYKVRIGQDIAEQFYESAYTLCLD